MLCRTVAVAVTRSWLQRLCGICPRAWLKDATPSSEPSSWCCRAWMNLAEIGYLYIYIYYIYILCIYIYILYIYNYIYIYCVYIYCIYIIIYIWIILCAKVASQVRKNQLLADFGSVGPDPRSMRKKQPDFADLRTPCIANFTICWRAPRGTLRKWGSHPKVFVAWCEILVRAGNSHGPQILVRL